MKTRSLIPNILIVTEGETEKIYLSHLRERNTNYSVHVKSYGGAGAVKILDYCESTFRMMKLNRGRGDVAICVLDVDRNTIENLETAITEAEKKKILLIISNPCIEAFFMLHFREGIPNLPPAEMKQKLTEYIEDYTETGDYWYLLSDMRMKAIERTRGFTLCRESLEQGIIGSNIYELFDLIERMKKKN